MIIAIHQPEFMPWLKFFDKMKRVDKYIVFDHVQFKKRYFENRNRVKQEDIAVWLSVPVKTKGKYLQRIGDVEIDNSLPWQNKLWAKIIHCYSKSPYFKEFGQEIESIIFAQRYERLINFNLNFIEWFRKILDINNSMLFSSRLDVDEYKGSNLILQICSLLGANQYLCGSFGKDYLNLDDFHKAGIEIIWQDFHHPQYPQIGDNFTPNLSALDIVLNCGLVSRDILFRNGI